MANLSKIWLSLLLFFLWLGGNSVEASRAKKKANKRITKLLGELFVKIREDDAIAVADAMKENPDLLNSKGGGGQTPLMASVLMGSTKCVDYLLSLGADTSIPEKDGYTPMHGAAFQGRAEIAKLLIAEGLDPNEVHSDGYLPVHRAAWGNEQRHTDTVKVFIDAGVDVCVEKASNGHTALAMTGNPQTRALLESFCSSASSHEELQRELQTADDEQSSITPEELQQQKSKIRSRIRNDRVESSIASNDADGGKKKHMRRFKKTKGKRIIRGGNVGQGNKRDDKMERIGFTAARKKSRKVADDDDD